MTKVCETKPNIFLTFLNGTGFIFNVDDYIYLRRKHRILGSLIGANNLKNLSADDFNLPVSLSYLETRVLLEEGIVRLVSKKLSLLREPTVDELNKEKLQRESYAKKHIEMYRKIKLQNAERSMETILLSKEKKLLESGIPQSDIHLDSKTILQEVTEQSTMDITGNIYEEITCAHHILHKAFMMRLKPICDNSLKYLVYRDLRQRGKYISNEDRYGTEFIVYYEDPLYSHSSHAIALIDRQSIRPTDFISIVRTCTEVNKYCVLAYLITNDDENNLSKQIYPEVHYQTVEWCSDNNALL